MYRPPVFVEHRPEVLHAAIRNHPLAALVTAGPGGLMANLIPFSLDAAAGPHGVLRAHLARANGQLAELAAGAEAMVLFQGPQAYVTPAWYASKVEHGKVVPTWNYVAVHAWGAPRVIDDATWVRGQVGQLTAEQEDGRPEPWAVADAPEPFIASQLRGIVGLEIPIARIEGKWKVSQNRTEADRKGVVDGLRAERWPDCDAVAQLVLGRGEP